MTQLTERELSKILTAWFERHAHDPNIWCTPAGKTMKQHLSSRGNWRQARTAASIRARKRGYLAMKAKMETGD